MDVLVVANDAIKALSLQATLDIGGHRVVGLADSATAALNQATSARPTLAIVQLDSEDRADLISELRNRLCVPALLVGVDQDCTDAHRTGALALLHEPCGSRLILRAVRIAAALREGRRPRGRLPRQIEVLGDRAGRHSRRQAKAAA
jgi:DNA-binding NarL/FixJ family response regulator